MLNNYISAKIHERFVTLSSGKGEIKIGRPKKKTKQENKNRKTKQENKRNKNRKTKQENKTGKELYFLLLNTTQMTIKQQ